ncbi:MULTISPECIES: oxygen-independent coproporphyrinogen III oxidase [unclassified Guyparkeria]|uniref:oxygen-independent coproporphyrinogen III oxidase n=1 Tax=unclassified Guyparkeria TaxID=2626246 RepID=UPI0007335CAE|nr:MULTISPECIES: oxygen-independent coproporphyrinogen III oxidase [unclassified Guyparkeria]KTG16090.1 coproporphyrinogen III oxidase [Guyparkeria sp. XI15]OAE84941.1 coproporphyrinogen III oxidase [Guyparkeria sp. WRN-7]
MSQTEIPFDADLIRRYDTSGPRYTSYPTAVQFHDGFSEDDYRAAAARSNAAGGPLSLYVHIPFCDTVCYYCACNKVVTKDRAKARPYLEDVYREMALQAALFDDGRPVDQLHWGGGTPTFLSHDEMRELMAKTAEHFALKTDDTGEYSIEIDPREADAATIRVLREIGFNRISLGVQDFDPDVQKAVNRIQSFEETREVVETAREQNFHGVSIDLIYGLPHQSRERFMKTLDRVIELDPDRLSIFNYAHLPQRFKPQRRIAGTDLPSPAEKLDILGSTIRYLQQAGYVLIGMDHFAKPDDPLAIAQREGTLQRNFQGYSTHAECDMVAMGASSISQVGGAFSQNVKDLTAYHEALVAGHLPIEKGVVITEEDVLRRHVITELICHFRLSIPEVEARFGIDFAEHFADALAELSDMAADELVTITPDEIVVQPRGRLLIRNVCMAFDEYHGTHNGQRFSKVI